MNLFEREKNKIYLKGKKTKFIWKGNKQNLFGREINKIYLEAKYANFH